jgi:hypothetical protein
MVLIPRILVSAGLSGFVQLLIWVRDGLFPVIRAVRLGEHTLGVYAWVKIMPWAASFSMPGVLNTALPGEGIALPLSP